MKRSSDVWRRARYGNRSASSDTKTEENVGDFQSGRGRGRHPPGLKGRDIGLWYAKRSTTATRKNMELQVFVDRCKIPEISTFLSSLKIEEPKTSVYKERASCGENSRDEDKGWLSIPIDPLNDDVLYREFKNRLTSKKCEEMQRYRKRLPAFDKSQAIIDAIASNQVVVISGETGCGKTTQVPQFILDSFIEAREGSQCNIICTQPRRISAITVAERVAEERNEVCGRGSVGYQIRLESKQPTRRGSILYCTTGIVLKYLQNDPLLNKASHVILDEIHERDLLSDFLMIILKDLLILRPDLKVVVMSATLNAEHFSKYFGNCPMLHIPGFTYPVKEYYLEDVLEMTRYVPSVVPQNFPRYRHKRQNKDVKKEEYEDLKDTFLRTLESNYHRQTITSLQNMDEEEMNYELMTELIKHIDRNHQDGAILVFLPGWDQISKLNNALTNDPFYSSSRHLIIPLHSMMETHNQRKVFDRPPRGVRKIVLATNIAETSITIDDVVFVVDSGRIKITNFDSNKVISTLNPEWVSLANARQRRGRAGRVQPGICFHLYTKLRENLLDSFQLPEILRTRLEELCLQIKVLKLGKIRPFISKALDPPSIEALDVAISLLEKLKALDKDENLTELGNHLAQLPLDPQTGKMILLGAIFGCVDPILTVAATLNFKDPFILPLGKEKEADAQKKRLSCGCKSDHILFIKAFDGWQRAKFSGREYQYCREHFLSVSTLRMLERMKDQLAEHLHHLKLMGSSNVKDRFANINSTSEKLVKAVVFAGLYPNIAKLMMRENQSHKPRSPPIRTLTDGSVSFHPKSVNTKENNFESCMLTYYTKVKSTEVFLHDVSTVSALSLVFFSEKVMLNKDNLIVDDNYKMVCDTETAKLVLEMRRYLHQGLESIYIQPQAINQCRDESIFTQVTSLLMSEETKLVPLEVSRDDKYKDEDK